MKKILLMLVAVICLGGFAANAQSRTKLYNGVYLVNYGGGTYGIEDDNTQQCISLSVAQAGIDRRNNQMAYRVVCGSFTRTVVKAGLKEAIKAGVKAAGVTQGASLIVSAASFAADKVYDGLCDYWGSSFE